MMRYTNELDKLTKDNIYDILCEKVYKIELTNAGRNHLCWVMANDSFCKVCALLEVEAHANDDTTLLGYKIKVSPDVRDGTIAFGSFLWDNKSEEDFSLNIYKIFGDFEQIDENIINKLNAVDYGHGIYNYKNIFEKPDQS